MHPSCYHERLRNIAWEHLARRAQFHAPRLAKLASVSSKTLERFFKRQFRTTPQKWLDQLRQANAERMALRGARTKEIAFQLGYRQPSHFCRKFKQSHGLPAKAWSAIARPKPAREPECPIAPA